MGGEENRRGEFGQHALGKIEVHIESFEPGKLLDLDLRKDLAADGLFRLIEWTLSPYRRPLAGARRRALDAQVPEHV